MARRTSPKLSDWNFRTGIEAGLAHLKPKLPVIHSTNGKCIKDRKDATTISLNEVERWFAESVALEEAGHKRAHDFCQSCLITLPPLVVAKAAAKGDATVVIDAPLTETEKEEDAKLETALKASVAQVKRATPGPATRRPAAARKTPAKRATKASS